ncbi:uncharacterized protein J3R85_003754 [Psidium guajava]|nr:uncharacterized protein J3R85_003754 [Psidium guajava]
MSHDWSTKPTSISHGPGNPPYTCHPLIAPSHLLISKNNSIYACVWEIYNTKTCSCASQLHIRFERQKRKPVTARHKKGSNNGKLLRARIGVVDGVGWRRLESLLVTGTEEEEREALLRGDAATPCSSGSSHGGREQVKIKVTKKELQELLKQVDMRKLSPQEVAESLLMDASAGGRHGGDRCSADKHHRPWRPGLKSIRRSTNITGLA